MSFDEILAADLFSVFSDIYNAPKQGKPDVPDVPGRNVRALMMDECTGTALRTICCLLLYAVAWL